MNSSISINTFSTAKTLLGEGPLWHPNRQSLFWLDILNQSLFEKSFTSNSSTFDNYWKLPEMVSALACNGTDTDSLFMISEKSYAKFQLSDGSHKPLKALNLDSNMRANDGGVGPDGLFWFGTMEKSPSRNIGNIYSISPSLELRKVIPNIGIPNTLCWSQNGNFFFLSDSLQQKMFRYTVTNNLESTNIIDTILDLSGTLATPDGGAIDSNNNLWNAQWDGFKLVCLDASGAALESIKLPVPKPTSCCFGGPNLQHLFITSAYEDMNNIDLEKYPESGYTFVIELPVQGSRISPFFMDI